MSGYDLVMKEPLSFLITMVALIILNRSNKNLRTALLFQAHKVVYFIADVCVYANKDETFNL
jgi:hypothetical protein